MGISIITEKGGNKEPKDQTTTPTNKTSSGLHFLLHQSIELVSGFLQLYFSENRS